MLYDVSGDWSHYTPCARNVKLLSRFFRKKPYFCTGLGMVMANSVLKTAITAAKVKR